MKITTWSVALTGVLWSMTHWAAGGQEVGSLLTRIKGVGREGAGNVEAGKAWRELVKAGPEALPQILTGLNDADPTAANWLRAAVEVMADQALASGKGLPTDKLEAFVKDVKNAGPARRLAFEQLSRGDPSAPDRLLPGMANDPGPELRREAVDRLLAAAKKIFDQDDKDQASAQYQKILEVARDQDQVKLVAGQLKKLGTEIDLTKHFGFITDWMVLGPFDNTGGKGFHTTFSPEKDNKLRNGHEGKGGKKIDWGHHVSTMPLGMVDFNKVIKTDEEARLKEVVAYARALVESPKERPVEIRCGSNNAVRIYLNGKEVYFREEYHHGFEMDQHVARGVLKAGNNEILIKVCQNEQNEPWTQLWSFQARVTDHLGAPVPLTVVHEKK